MKFYRLLAILLCALLVLSGCATQEISVSENFDESSFSSEYSEGEISEVSSEPPEEIAIPAITQTLFHNIPSAAMYEADTLRPIYEQNTHEKRAPASLTKLVTASVALEYATAETVYTVGSEITLVPWDSSVCGIRRGQVLTLEQLLHGLLMCSGNDAAYTIAVNIARDVSGEQLNNEAAVAYFCGLMNSFAESVGMCESHFASPDGYEAAGQYSTASDLAIIADYAMDVELIASIASTPRKAVVIESGESFDWYNSNFFLQPQLAFYDARVTGLKTGSTSVAGKCLISTVEMGGKRYIIVVLGCETEEQRYGYSSELIDYLEFHTKK